MSPDQPLPFRRRTDLVIVAVGAATPRWSVKDPLAQRFYQLHQAEHFILQQLDGRTSLKDVVQRFSRLFAPQELTLSQVMQFVQQLWSQGLLVVDHPAQAAALVAAASQQRGRSRWQWLASPLAIRFRGIDPDRVLTALLPVVSWMMSTPALIAAALLVFSGAVVAISELPQIVRELRAAGAAAQGSRLVMLAGVLAVIKICHELGHAFVCKRMGGECRELGLMLLVGIPCLYCNVSDAWLLKSRWQRAAVGAAGMGVELVFAAIAAWAWVLSEPGMIHSMALPVMLFCSVNTLLLNGNPLLRYDGYYILTDLVDVPNLRPRALSVLQRWWMKLLWGVTPDGSAGAFGRTLALGLFGLCSWLYLWMVLGVILWALYQWLEPYGLGALVVAAGAAMIAVRARGAMQRFRLLFRRALQSSGEVGATSGVAGINMGHWRIYLGTALLPLLLIGLLFVPVPRSVSGPIRVVAKQEQSIFVTVPGLLDGLLDQQIQTGTHITQGEVMWQLSNDRLEQERLELSTTKQRQQRRLETLESRMIQNPGLAAEVSSAETQLRDASERLARHEEKLERLQLVASQTGTVIPGAARLAVPLPDRKRASPLLETRGDRLWLRAGDEAARIVSEERAAVLYVAQVDLPNLQRDQSVRLSLPEMGGAIVLGRVAEVSARPLMEVPPALLRDGRLPVSVVDDAVEFQPPVHEVRIALDRSAPALQWLNQVGTARISLASEPLWMHLSRLLHRTFPGLG